MSEYCLKFFKVLCPSCGKRLMVQLPIPWSRVDVIDEAPATCDGCGAKFSFTLNKSKTGIPSGEWT